MNQSRPVLRRLDHDRLVRDLDLAPVDLLDGLVELLLAARLADRVVHELGEDLEQGVLLRQAQA